MSYLAIVQLDFVNFSNPGMRCWWIKDLGIGVWVYGWMALVFGCMDEWMEQTDRETECHYRQRDEWLDGLIG